MESIIEQKSALPLTDENQRLVNLNLLHKVKGYKQGGVRGVYKRLDPSCRIGEKSEPLKEDTMRTAINRDIKKLDEIAGDPKEIHKWVARINKKKEGLQIRITANNFLLNNILSILGVGIGDLFDRNQLHGQAEGFLDGNPDGLDESMEIVSELKDINSRLDTIIENYSGEKFRKNYFARYNDLFQYIFIFKNIFTSAFCEPEKYGFSFFLENGSRRKLLPEIICGCDCCFVLNSLNQIHRRDGIHGLFNKIPKEQDADLNFRRMIYPVFMIAILGLLLAHFIRNGIRNEKPIFRFFEGDSSNYIVKGIADNKLSENVKGANERTLNTIKFMLKFKIKSDDATCVKYEVMCVRFFDNVYNLIKSQLPILGMRVSPSNLKNIEDHVRKVFNLGLYWTFGIKPEQLNFLKDYITDSNKAQRGLKNFS